MYKNNFILLFDFTMLEVITAEQSKDLTQYFSTLRILEHEGGHYLPATGQPKLDLLDFLRQMQQVCSL